MLLTNPVELYKLIVIFANPTPLSEAVTLITKLVLVTFVPLVSVHAPNSTLSGTLLSTLILETIAVLFNLFNVSFA